MQVLGLWEEAGVPLKTDADVVRTCKLQELHNKNQQTLHPYFY